MKLAFLWKWKQAFLGKKWKLDFLCKNENSLSYGMETGFHMKMEISFLKRWELALHFKHGDKEWNLKFALKSPLEDCHLKFEIGFRRFLSA